jgi:uncharacterized protein
MVCWRALALLSLALGGIGVVLPGLPTVPFVLLSAFAAGKGWPKFEECQRQSNFDPLTA